MGYKQSPFPMVQGTQGHRDALASPNKSIFSAIGSFIGKAAKTVGKGAKAVVGKGKEVVGKGKEAVKTTAQDVVGKGKDVVGKGKEVVGKGKGTAAGETKAADVTDIERKPSQQIRQEKRLAKVKARRTAKGKGKSMREMRLEKKAAMSPDERLAMRERKVGAAKRAASYALGIDPLETEGSFEGSLPNWARRQNKNTGYEPTKETGYKEEKEKDKDKTV